MDERRHHVHFAGIGGIGMSGIAELLHNMGYTVSGSDLVASETTRRLASLGVPIAIGHDPANLPPATDVVVLSSAVKRSNPEVVRARELGIPVIPRAEMLAELMRMKTGVAIAGSHGKTTTTSLIGEILAEGGLDPTVVIGGRLRALGTNARLGRGRVLVAEADESDGSFLLLSPTVAIVTNVDPEHLDHFGTIERVEEAFVDFANRVPFYGRVILGLDHPRVRAIVPRLKKPIVTYGFAADADWTAVDVVVEGASTRFTVRRRGVELGEVTLAMPGRHVAQNALAAIAAADELGVGFEPAARALAGFRGIHRRFEVLGEARGVLVVDDYAHHPEELRATLRAAREGFERRLVVAFQPHRYTRTRDLFEDFLGAFDDADVLFVTEVYGAGETPIEGATGRALADAIVRRGHVDVRYAADLDALATDVEGTVTDGDLFLTAGAGDVHRVGRTLLDRLGGLRAVPGAS